MTDQLKPTQADKDVTAKILGYRDWADATDYRLSHERDQVLQIVTRHRLAHSGNAERESGVIKALFDAWDKHCAAVERMNAARPDIATATRAEYALYDERYQAAEEAKRDWFAAMHDFVKNPAARALSVSGAAIEQGGAEETRCDECGGVNPVWFAPNDVWNLVVGGPDATDDPGGILCPICFIRKAEGAGVRPTAWALSPERLTTDQSQAERLREALRREIVNSPETADFMAGVPLEAAHQRERWGADHDAGKSPFDWFWLIGFLGQKAAAAAVAGDTEKAMHHTISTAAALANWHAALSGADTSMRPGILPPMTARNPGAKPTPLDADALSETRP